MCKRVICDECKKYTWAGCGQHIQQALAGLKDEEICKCKEESKTDSNKVESVPTLVQIN